MGILKVFQANSYLMTAALHDIIRAKIKAEGPITVADYMALCLTHPEHGYYTKRDPLGAAGDFTTAPEMTQAFGELLGLWAVETWKNLGSPAKFTLCELGPGRGTLMSDALRAAQMVPDFMNALQPCLLEASPALKEKQRAALAAYKPAWIDNLGQLPEQPVIFIANEFFDALPVRQFQRTKDGWKERRIAVGAGDAFVFTLASAIDAPTYEMDEGLIVETSPAAVEFAAQMARPIVKHRGAGLIIDYGDDEVFTETLQAVTNHRAAHLLSTPGMADITAHVSFTPLSTSVRKIGCRVYGPIDQGEFLLSLGLKERTAQLCLKANEEQQRSLNAALHRLTAGDAMGKLFKAFAFSDKATHAPPGFF